MKWHRPSAVVAANPRPFKEPFLRQSSAGAKASTQSTNLVHKSELPELTPEHLKGEGREKYEAGKPITAVVEVNEDEYDYYSIETVDEAVEISPVYYSATQSIDPVASPSNIKVRLAKSLNDPQQHTYVQQLLTKSSSKLDHDIDTSKQLHSFSEEDIDLVAGETRPKVLLVENHVFDRQILTKCIVDVFNIEPDLAEDGDEAIRLFKDSIAKGKYLCICIDIGLAHKEGYATAIKIRDVERQQHIDKTFIVGLHKEEDLNASGRCRQYGIDASVLKTYKDVKAFLVELTSLKA